MDLRDCYNIAFLFIFVLNFTMAQATDVRCINPEFDQLVDSYLDYSIPVISVGDAYESKDNYVFLDTRELEEYTTSHIAGAVHIGYDDFDLKQIKSSIPTDANVIVYCSIGYRSEKIGQILKDNGYLNVLNLYGSIFEWVNQHRPVYSKNGQLSSDIHTYNRKWSKWVENEELTKKW
ncbi:MAG: rhodanese-like domain-containing protein [Bacteroidota bacterium]